MTASTNRGATIVGGLILSGVLAIIGVTFFGLSIAFPVAMIVIDQLPAYVSASDRAIAAQIGAFWPLFTVASIGFAVASLVTIVKLIQRVSPAK